MQHIKITLSLLLIGFLATGSFAQDKQTKGTNHSHPEYEKSLKDIQDKVKKADDTYDLAQETYKVTKEYDRTMDNRERQFFWFLGVVISCFSAFGIGTFIYNSVISSKGRKEAKQEIANAKIELTDNTKKQFDLLKKEIIEQHSLEIKKIVSVNKKTVYEMVSSKERDYYLRENAKIIVINHKETPISLGFEKVLGLFESFDLKRDMMHLEKLSDVLSSNNINKFKDADLVIIENQDTKMQWKIGNAIPSIELLKQIANAGKSTYDNLEDNSEAHLQNQSIILNLINQICDHTALVYYGPGILQTSKADETKQHLIAFAQSPSTLYSNIMNLLKFKDILNNH